jgi:cytochrome c6
MSLRLFIATIFLLSFMVSSSFAWIPQSSQVKKAAVAAICGWTLVAGSACAADIAKGQQIFDSNCAACHVGGQNLINAPRTLQKEAIEKNLGSLDPTTIQDFVQNSVVHRGAFILGSKLSNKDFENVVSYVVDQASNDKWMAN